MKKHFYAWNYTYGVCTDKDGKRIGNLFAFSNRKERDAFVANGADYRTQSGYREALPAGDSDVRSCLHLQKQQTKRRLL